MKHTSNCLQRINIPLLYLLALISVGVGQLTVATNLAVAPDGSGQYTNLQQAIMAVPAGTADNPVIIHIKPGTYRELIHIQREKRFFHLVGEDAEKTIITFNLSANMKGLDGKPIGTFRTPTVVIDAEDFTVENITFENSAGAVGQALAIRIEGDRSIYRNCRFPGWQDTILANRGRHYLENCYIEGATDFIFGGATCFFEKCQIHFSCNVSITSERGIACTDAQDITFNNVEILNSTGPVISLLGSRDIQIDRLSYTPGAQTLIKASGTNNTRVIIKNTDLKSAKENFALSNGATREAFKLE